MATDFKFTKLSEMFYTFAVLLQHKVWRYNVTSQGGNNNNKIVEQYKWWRTGRPRENTLAACENFQCSGPLLSALTEDKET